MKQERVKFEATLGEFMRVASQIAFDRSENTAEAYAMTHLIVIEMVRRSFGPARQGQEILGEEARRGYLH